MGKILSSLCSRQRKQDIEQKKQEAIAFDQQQEADRLQAKAYDRQMSKFSNQSKKKSKKTKQTQHKKKASFDELYAQRNKEMKTEQVKKTAQANNNNIPSTTNTDTNTKTSNNKTKPSKTKPSKTKPLICKAPPKPRQQHQPIMSFSKSEDKVFSLKIQTPSVTIHSIPVIDDTWEAQIACLEVSATELSLRNTLRKLNGLIKSNPQNNTAEKKKELINKAKIKREQKQNKTLKWSPEIAIEFKDCLQQFNFAQSKGTKKTRNYTLKETKDFKQTKQIKQTKEPPPPTTSSGVPLQGVSFSRPKMMKRSSTSPVTGKDREKDFFAEQRKAKEAKRIEDALLLKKQEDLKIASMSPEQLEMYLKNKKDEEEHEKQKAKALKLLTKGAKKKLKKGKGGKGRSKDKGGKGRSIKKGRGKKQ